MNATITRRPVFGADPYASYDVTGMPGGYSYRVWTASNNVTIIGGPRNVGETYSQSSSVGRAIMDQIRALGRAKGDAVPVATPGPSYAPTGSSTVRMDPVGAALLGVGSALKPLVNLIPGTQNTAAMTASLRAAQAREQAATTQIELARARQQTAIVEAQMRAAQIPIPPPVTPAAPSVLPWVAIGALVLLAALALRKT